MGIPQTELFDVFQAQRTRILAWLDANAEESEEKRRRLGALGRRRSLETDARVIRALREATRTLSAEGGSGSKVGRLQDEVEALKGRLGKLADRLESEQDYISEILMRHGGNISKASREADIDRKYFRKLMVKHGIDADG